MEKKSVPKKVKDIFIHEMMTVEIFGLRRKKI